MKRTLRLADRLRVQEHNDRTRDIILRVDREVLESLIVDVLLLRECLVNTLDCMGERGVVVSLSISPDSRQSICWRRDTAVNVELLSRDAEFLHSFLLKYYRDGQAEVDHIDINLYTRDTHGEQGMLIIKAADSKPGIRGEEARRILGVC